MKEEQCIRLYEDPSFIEACRQALSEKEQTLTRSSEFFKLLGGELRARILFLLLQGRELCVCDLADITGSRISAISQQLRKLHDGGLLEKRREGRTILYQVAKTHEPSLRAIFNIWGEEEALAVSNEEKE